MSASARAASAAPSGSSACPTARLGTPNLQTLPAAARAHSGGSGAETLPAAPPAAAAASTSAPTADPAGAVEADATLAIFDNSIQPAAWRARPRRPRHVRRRRAPLGINGRVRSAAASTRARSGWSLRRCQLRSRAACRHRSATPRARASGASPIDGTRRESEYSAAARPGHIQRSAPSV